ncbi:uncharacterized protein LAESUDRAFT_450191 [Laetiporus sulphureus 93-53]|uniref:Integral membrane protein n=1 Tax=Laetiporus sulphureus 93-53 TaxID=1314785 RepID=A0A165BWF0_9APHY|nr:uncharacterized protein LAESUDRAFT_450191 [Laetiporus sulphureus 93-53]KZT01773.1 hypothetical protein LAESUDRAFT_450191 [Laetiporus sulphureus 93-53]
MPNPRRHRSNYILQKILQSYGPLKTFLRCTHLIMVNWQDPAVIASELTAFVKLSYVVDAIYLWEWVTNLGFDWRVLRDKITLPAAAYLLCRFATLFVVITDIIIMNIITDVNCSALTHVVLVSSFIALAAASLIIVLRVVAIWFKNPYITVLAVTIFLVNVGCLIYGVAKGPRTQWDVAAKYCFEVEIGRGKINIVAAFASDTFLLILMIIGIWRNRGSGSLWELIWRQGVVWIASAMAAYIPLVVLICLDLNIPMDMMLQIPTYLMLVICATRLHRQLYMTARSGHVYVSTGNVTRFRRFEAASTTAADHEIALYPVHAPNEASSGITVTRDICVESDTVKLVPTGGDNV